MFFSINVIMLSNSAFSSWPPSEFFVRFLDAALFSNFLKNLVSSWVLASVLLLFYFCCFNSSIFAFNAAISFDWFCWLVFDSFLVGDLDLLLEYFKVNDWSYCCSVGLSLVRFVFWLTLQKWRNNKTSPQAEKI